MRLIFMGILLAVLASCSTANVCPMGDQSQSCKCWRHELPSSECHHFFGGDRR